MTRLALAVLLAALALAGAEPARAFGGAARKGTSGAQFLELSPGARATAMGEAFGGVADDVEAVYYNPAGLANLRRVEVSGMHDQLFQGMSYDFLAAAVPVLTWSRQKRDKADYGVLGLSVYSLSVGGLQRRGLIETDAPVDTFDAASLAYALSYAWRPGGGAWSVGGTVKSVQERLDSTRGAATALDAGALYRGDRLSLGAGVRDAGQALRIGSTADPLPTSLYAGASWQLLLGWLLAAEADLPRDGPAGLALGAEYRTLVADKLSTSARAGYDSRSVDPGQFSGASVGVGLAYGGLGFDFSFSPFGELGSAYKYSLRARF